MRDRFSGDHLAREVGAALELAAASLVTVSFRASFRDNFAGNPYASHSHLRVVPHSLRRTLSCVRARSRLHVGAVLGSAASQVGRHPGLSSSTSSSTSVVARCGRGWFTLRRPVRCRARRLLLLALPDRQGGELREAGCRGLVRQAVRTGRLQEWTLRSLSAWTAVRWRSRR